MKADGAAHALGSSMHPTWVCASFETVEMGWGENQRVMNIGIHRAIIFVGRIRSTMTISSSMWNIKHQRRFAPLWSRDTPMAHHAAGLGVVLPDVGHRARPVQVGIHRERLHFGNHHIEMLFISSIFLGRSVSGLRMATCIMRVVSHNVIHG